MSYIDTTEEYKGYTYQIVADENAGNPRTEWDNATHMVCWHRNYYLGDMEIVAKRSRPVSDEYSEPIDLLYELAGLDKDDCQDEDGNDYSYEQLYESIEKQGSIIQPLYLYDHSGITISTGSFSCPWDSGQVGWVYMTKDDIGGCYGDTSEESYERAKKLIEGEVQTYDDYLTGNVWGWEVLQDGDVVDSCWGYYGDEGKKDAEAEAMSMIDYKCKEAQKEYEKQPKKLYAEMATI